MIPESQLSTRPETQLSEPSVANMLQTALAQGVTKDNADALGKMMELYERMEARGAEKAFSAAFVALQSDLPVIVAKTEIKNRGKYEKFEDVMTVVGPLLKRHGFCVSFSNAYDETRIIETCKLSHIGGHSQANNFAVRVSKNADSETQADCKAATTAKRNALLNALNIVIRQDCLTAEHDPTMGDDKAVTKEQAEEIRALVKAGRFDEKDTLAWLDSESFEAIAANRYDDAVGYLKPKKERKLDERNPDGTFKF